MLGPDATEEGRSTLQIRFRTATATVVVVDTVFRQLGRAQQSLFKPHGAESNSDQEREAAEAAVLTFLGAPTNTGKSLPFCLADRMAYCERAMGRKGRRGGRP